MDPEQPEKSQPDDKDKKIVEDVPALPTEATPVPVATDIVINPDEKTPEFVETSQENFDNASTLTIQLHHEDGTTTIPVEISDTKINSVEEQKPEPEPDNQISTDLGYESVETISVPEVAVPDAVILPDYQDEVTDSGNTSIKVVPVVDSGKNFEVPVDVGYESVETISVPEVLVQDSDIPSDYQDQINDIGNTSIETVPVVESDINPDLQRQNSEPDNKDQVDLGRESEETISVPFPDSNFLIHPNPDDNSPKPEPYNYELVETVDTIVNADSYIIPEAEPDSIDQIDFGDESIETIINPDQSTLELAENVLIDFKDDAIEILPVTTSFDEQSVLGLEASDINELQVEQIQERNVEDPYKLKRSSLGPEFMDQILNQLNIIFQAAQDAVLTAANSLQAMKAEVQENPIVITTDHAKLLVPPAEIPEEQVVKRTKLVSRKLFDSAPQSKTDCVEHPKTYDSDGFTEEDTCDPLLALPEENTTAGTRDLITSLQSSEKNYRTYGASCSSDQEGSSAKTYLDELIDFLAEGPCCNSNLCDDPRTWEKDADGKYNADEETRQSILDLILPESNATPEQIAAYESSLLEPVVHVPLFKWKSVKSALGFGEVSSQPSTPPTNSANTDEQVLDNLKDLLQPEIVNDVFTDQLQGTPPKAEESEGSPPKAEEGEPQLFLLEIPCTDKDCLELPPLNLDPINLAPIDLSPINQAPIELAPIAGQGPADTDGFTLEEIDLTSLVLPAIRLANLNVNSTTGEEGN